jgi:hypothetical protein
MGNKSIKQKVLAKEHVRGKLLTFLNYNCSRRPTLNLFQTDLVMQWPLYLKNSMAWPKF